MVTSLKRRSADAFTILELLIVIAIIGVLAAISVPSNRGSGERRWLRDCRSVLKSLALENEGRRMGGGSALDISEAGIAKLQEDGSLPKRLPACVRSGDRISYFRVPQTDDIACERHGLIDFDSHRSAREQLAEAGVTDRDTLRRMSDRPVCEIDRTERLEKIGLWAFGGAALLFLFTEIFYFLARLEAGGDAKPGPERVAVAFAMFFIGAGIGGLVAQAQLPKSTFARKLTFRADPVPKAAAPAKPQEAVGSTAPESPEPSAVTTQRLAQELAEQAVPPPSSRTRTAAGKEKLLRVLVIAGLVGDSIDEEILRSLADDDLDVTAAAAFALNRLRERTDERAWKPHEKTIDRALRRQAQLSKARRAAGLGADQDPWSGLAALGDLDKQKSTEMLNKFADDQTKEGKSGFLFRAMGRVLGAGAFDAVAQAAAMRIAGLTSPRVRAVVDELAAGAPGPLATAARAAAVELAEAARVMASPSPRPTVR